MTTIAKVINEDKSLNDWKEEAVFFVGIGAAIGEDPDGDEALGVGSGLGDGPRESGVTLISTFCPA